MGHRVPSFLFTSLTLSEKGHNKRKPLIFVGLPFVISMKVYYQKTLYAV